MICIVPKKDYANNVRNDHFRAINSDTSKDNFILLNI